MTKARYIMIGGFLGAGKTTTVLEFAKSLTEQGLSVGLITNDQSYGLVDTKILSSHGFPVEEITGGCFCCKFNSLIDAAKNLSLEDRPDVFLAEPVGSCTDLRATVSLPLQQIYGDDYRIAPLSVLVDPVRALRILGLEEGPKFSSKVLYVYKKQLEEAENIVINKADLISEQQLESLKAGLAKHYPQAQLQVISAREGTGLNGLFTSLLTTESEAGAAPDIDYDMYAEGEALLGWFNARIELSAEDEFDGNEFLKAYALALREDLLQHQFEIAHLKMTLTPIGLGGEIAALNLVRNDAQAELSHSLMDSLEEAELLINLRAEGDPETVFASVRTALSGLVERFHYDFEWGHHEHFRPARPVPTHRVSGL